MNSMELNGLFLATVPLRLKHKACKCPKMHIRDFMYVCKCITYSYFRGYVTTQGGTGELWGYGGLGLLPRESVTQMSSAFLTVPFSFL